METVDLTYLKLKYGSIGHPKVINQLPKKILTQAHRYVFPQSAASEDHIIEMVYNAAHHLENKTFGINNPYHRYIQHLETILINNEQS